MEVVGTVLVTLLVVFGGIAALGAIAAFISSAWSH